MSKYHYTIKAKKRLKEENDGNGNKRVIINGVIEINENRTDIYAPYSIKKGKRDPVFNGLMWFAICDCVLMVFLMIIANIFGLNENLSALTSDFVSAAGLLAMVYSFSKPREFIGKMCFLFGETGNKLYVSFITFFLALFIAIVLWKIGFSDRFSNLISVACVIVALKGLQ